MVHNVLTEFIVFNMKFSFNHEHGNDPWIFFHTWISDGSSPGNGVSF